ncbi:hypothetical protein ACJX0J_009449, partial [Zea mays]
NAQLLVKLKHQIKCLFLLAWGSTAIIVLEWIKLHDFFPNEFKYCIRYFHWSNKYGERQVTSSVLKEDWDILDDRAAILHAAGVILFSFFLALNRIKFDLMTSKRKSEYLLVLTLDNCFIKVFTCFFKALKAQKVKDKILLSLKEKEANAKRITDLSEVSELEKKLDESEVEAFDETLGGLIVNAAIDEAVEKLLNEAAKGILYAAFIISPEGLVIGLQWVEMSNFPSFLPRTGTKYGLLALLCIQL